MSRLFKACSLCGLASLGPRKWTIEIGFTSMVNKILKGAKLAELPGGTTDEVRVRHQSQSRQADRINHSSKRFSQSRSSYQMKVLSTE